jgi:hypothetical protein
LHRLSYANHLDSPDPIGDELGLKWWELPPNIFNEEACEKISVLSGCDKKLLYSKSHHSILTKLDEKQIQLFFHRTRVKYCPTCLADKKIHQFLWGLKPISLCAKHHVILINTCHGCHRMDSVIKIIRDAAKIAINKEQNTIHFEDFAKAYNLHS